MRECGSGNQVAGGSTRIYGITLVWRLGNAEMSGPPASK
jgi:hypothetical protein